MAFSRIGYFLYLFCGFISFISAEPFLIESFGRQVSDGAGNLLVQRVDIIVFDEWKDGEGYCSVSVMEYFADTYPA